MVQFSYSRLHCGIETVSCLVLQGMARMDMDYGHGHVMLANVTK